MFVYIWKDVGGVPFYVGCTRSASRTNPRNSGNRNWLCRQKIESVGYDNIVIELRHVASIEEGRDLETRLIEEYGRINIGTGTLTNLRAGGDGLEPMTAEHKAKLSVALKGRKRTPEQIEKQRKRMKDPDVQAKMRGANNPSKRPEVREKLKARWQDPEFRAARVAERKKPRTLSEEAANALVKRITDPSNPMSKQHLVLNTDPEIKRKRAEGLHAAKSRIMEKLNDPEAKAKRIAKLKETMNSPEYKERRKSALTPEGRARMSAAKKAYWAKKREEKVM